MEPENFKSKQHRYRHSSIRYDESMKQIIQSFKTGETILEDIPAPQVSRGNVLIKTTRSLVSLGTERMLVEFGKIGVSDEVYIQNSEEERQRGNIYYNKSKS